MVSFLLLQLCAYLFSTPLESPATLWLCGSQIPQRDADIAAMNYNASSPVDPRVELCPTRSSQVVPVTGASKIIGESTGHAKLYSAVRKRAYRRARRRAELHGGTMYRGQWMSAIALGTTHAAAADNSGVQPRDRPVKLERTTTTRLRIRSYNASGLTGPVYDYLHYWLTTECQEDVVILQELHWGCGRGEAAWQIPGWTVIVSASPDNRCAGVGVFISTKVVPGDLVSFRTCIPGRLLHVRCTDESKTLDIIAGYQWVRTDGGDKCTADRRSHFWTQLGLLLHSIPTRNLVVVGADFNTQCRPLSGLVGRGVMDTTRSPDAELESLLNEHQLVLLNTWGRSRKYISHTYRFDDVYSQIDFLAMRRPTADRVARQARAQQFDLSPWRGGAKHRAIVASIPWRAGWTFHARNIAPVKFSLPQMRQSLKHWDAKAQALHNWIRHTLQHAPPELTLQKLNTRVLTQCVRLYPKGKAVVSKPSTQPAVIESIRSMKLAQRALQSHPKCRSLRGIIEVWRLLTAFRRRGRELRVASKLARRQWFEEHIQEAEQAAQRQDLGSVYRVINRLAPKRRYEKVRIRSSTGEMLGPQAEFREILQYFRNAFDGPVPATRQPGQQIVFSPEEVHAAIQKLKGGKAVPTTSIPAELWKLCPEEFTQRLTRILNASCSRHFTFPSEMTNCELSLLPKPNKTSKRPSDLRPLGLQDPSSKVVAIAVRERLQQYVTSYVNSRPQFAYVTGKAIDGAIARVLAHCSDVRSQMKHATPTVHERRAGRVMSQCFGGAMISLDLSRAFDEVPREALRSSLSHAQVPEELQELIVALHMQCVYKVAHKGQSGSFPMNKGVRQGCALSPLLFTIYTCHIYDVLVSRTSSAWAEKAATLFADDTHFSWVIRDISDLKFLVRCIRVTFKTFQEFGMTLNMDKSRIVVKL